VSAILPISRSAGAKFRANSAKVKITFGANKFMAYVVSTVDECDRCIYKKSTSRGIHSCKDLKKSSFRSYSFVVHRFTRKVVRIAILKELAQLVWLLSR